MAQNDSKPPEQDLAYLQDLVENVTDLIQGVRPDGTFLYVNRAWQQTLGYRREELSSLNVFDVIHPDMRSKCREIFRRVLSGEVVEKLETVFLAKNGKAIELEASVNCRFENGKPVATRSILRDVSERKRAEEQLRLSEERYRQIVAGSLQGILIHQNGVICFANESLANMFEYDSPNELVGRPIWGTFVSSDFRDELQERTRRLLAGERLPPHRGWRAVGKHGKCIWVTTSASRIEWRGQPAIVSFYLDITEQKQAEESLRESNSFLRMSQRVGKVGSWQWDLRTNRVNWSEAMFDIYGITPAEFDGSLAGVVRFTHPDDLSSVESGVQTIIAGGHAGPIEFRIAKLNGEVRTLWGHSEIECDAKGNPAFATGTVMDITDRKRSEEERRRLEAQIQHVQKLESLGVLAGGIAHDFNNLLTSMLGYANLAMMQLPNESPAVPMLLEIEKAAQRAADLTQQMLAYSGKGKFQIQVVRLDTLVQEMTKLLETVVSKKATLRLDLQPAAIEGDATQIRQVVMNLITNASDALNGRVGAINVCTGVGYFDARSLRSPYFPDELPSKEYAFVQVEDEGCGISPENLIKIFDPFFSTKFTGRGLGLAAVLGIIRGHRGAIRVNSTLGCGSCFQILIPSCQPTLESHAVSRPSTSLPKGRGLILVIEDEPSVRSFVRQALTSAGFEVLEAEDGPTGLRLTRERQHEIVAVLLDLTMPHMDGVEVLLELQRLDSNKSVLVMSGYSEAEVASRLSDARASDFIQKPFSPRELTARIHQILGSRRTGNEAG